MNALINLVLGLALVLFGVTAFADDVQLAPGARFEYKVTGPDGDQKAVYTVAERTTDGGYKVDVRRTTDPKSQTYWLNSERNVVKWDDRPVNGTDGWKLFRPNDMKVGDSWASKFSYPHSRIAGSVVDANLKANVVKAERITTPAGSFDTLVIETRVDYKLSHSGYSNYMEQTIWYAPAVGYWVRNTLRDWGSKNTSSTVHELSGISLNNAAAVQ